MSDNINKSVKNDSDKKKITFVAIAIMVLMITTTGSTYAFFALSASNASTVTGTAASARLTLEVTKSLPTKSSTGVMVPQLASALGTAMNATNGCVDANTNIVCQVYTIKVSNYSTAKVKLDGFITFAGSTSMPNLKWMLASGVNTLGTTGTAAAANVTTKQSLAADVSLNASTNGTTVGGTQTYYLVIWIDETNSAQTDTGTYTATISFEGDDGRGITSTIRS